MSVKAYSKSLLEQVDLWVDQGENDASIRARIAILYGDRVEADFYIDLARARITKMSGWDWKLVPWVSRGFKAFQKGLA